MQFGTADVDRIARRAQCGPELAAGYYHSNHRIEVDGLPVLVRVPLVGAEEMDLQIWREADIQEVAYEQSLECPRVLGFSPDSGAQIHEFVSGVVVNDRWPRGIRVPSRVLHDIVSLFSDLATVPSTVLPPLPHDWPKSGDTAGLLLRLMDKTRQVYQSHLAGYGWLYEAIGLPRDPFLALQELTDALGARRFVLCHCDVHRGNSIVRGGSTIFIDWENALYADPAYEVATHLHKSAYQPDEEARLLDMLIRELPSTSARRLVADTSTYRNHERVKSIIVDAVRYRQKARSSGRTDSSVAALASRLTDKLRLAAPVWDGSPPSRAVVEEALRS